MKILTYIIIIIAILVLVFFIDAGLVWLACWGLNAIGIHTIGGWNVVFSWPLVVVVMVITALFGSIFKINTKD